MNVRSHNQDWIHASLCVALVLLSGCHRGSVRASGTAIQDSVTKISDDPIALTQYLSRNIQVVEAKPDELAGPHPIDFYVHYALENNQAIQAAVNDVEAARSRIPQARSLEDPMLDAKGYPFFPNTPQSASGRATAGVGVSQKFPWFGKLRLQGEIAHQELHIAEAKLAATQLEVTEQTKRAYFEIYYIQRAIAITQENRKTLEQIAEIARIRYEAKREVTQQDSLRAEVELSNIESELIRMRQELASSQARLARLLNISPNTDLRADPELRETEITIELDRLYDLAVASRPELRAELHAIERERNAKALACKQYYPDATIGIDWMENTTHKAIAPTADGLDDVGMSLTVNLPIYHNRLDAAVREADARTLAATRRYDSERDQTLEMVKDRFAQVESQRELVRLFRDSILPKLLQTLEVSMVGYKGGQIDFQQLLSNFQEVLKIQIMLERQRSQLEQSLASLERAVGGTLQAPMGQPVSAPGKNTDNTLTPPNSEF